MTCLEEGSDFSQPFRDMDASGEAISLPICRAPFFSAILFLALVTSSASSVTQRVPPATTTLLHPLQETRSTTRWRRSHSPTTTYVLHIVGAISVYVVPPAIPSPGARIFFGAWCIAYMCQNAS